MNTHKATPQFTRHLASSENGDAILLATTLAFELGGTAESPKAPAWVQIFPKGPNLAAVDGRKWKLTDPDAFVAAQNEAIASSGRPIMVDYDQLSSFMPDEGGDQTASGWIDELEVRDGEIWAKVAWTVRAAKQIEDREYRFVSPEFRSLKANDEVVILDALALVNRPAFTMSALASRSKSRNNGDTTMKNIAKALGLPEDATEATVLAKIASNLSELETANASATHPSLAKFVPRADYDAVLATAKAAKDDLAELKGAGRKAEVDALVGDAVKAGKITPPSKDHYISIAMRDDDGFDTVKELCAVLPVLTGVSGLDDRDASKGSGLTELQKDTAASMGISEDDYAKTLAMNAAT